MNIFTDQKRDDEQIKAEFFAEMGKRFGDTLIAVEMVCLEADGDVFFDLKLNAPQKNTFWGLLILGKKGLYFYAHPNEPVLLGFLRGFSNGKRPTEQSFSFSECVHWKAEQVKKRFFFAQIHEPYLLKITATLASSGTKEIIFYMRTQNKAGSVLEKIKPFFT